MNTITTISNDAYQYSMYFLTYAIVLSATVMYFNYTDMMNSFSYSTLGFVLFSVVVIVFSSIYYSPLLKEKSPNMTTAYIAAGLIMFASGISSIFAMVTPEEAQQVGIALLALTGITLIIIFAFFFYIFGSYLKQKRGLIGFIINFIFFIPCMLLDFIEYIKREYNLTTRTELILAFIEILVIIAYFTITPSMDSGVTYILKQPVFLNKKTVALPNVSSLSITQSDGKTIMPSNFSISMWVYLNLQTSSFMNPDGSSHEVEIFNYGNGKPKINYTNNVMDNAARDMYLFYFTDSAKKPNYQLSLPGQKWNNIVFNYRSNNVDLFINGKLETTFTFNETDLLPQYSTNDTISTGKDGGLNGAICNITYNSSNLENHQIVHNYNLLMLKNPPLL